ncbi:MAG: 4Fe-4S dicluster domain-containing protein [Clostridia bacterium]|nr:4Fe-4S dicluster domain-containing protein [Clostridia bacterium]
MAAKQYPVINFEPCLSCQVCSDACPISCIELTLNGKVAGFDKWNNFFPVVDKAKCTGCGRCCDACPVEAIRMEAAS